MSKRNNPNSEKLVPTENGEDSRLVEAIQAWMVLRVSEELKVPPAAIDIHEPLLNYGVDSVIAFSLTGELADRLGQELPTTLFWDFPTLGALAGYVANEIKGGAAGESLLGEIQHALSQVEELSEDELSQSGKKRN